jgi:hypothetical protein
LEKNPAFLEKNPVSFASKSWPRALVLQGSRYHRYDIDYDSIGYDIDYDVMIMM